MTLIKRVAPTKANILVTGESGTGKELRRMLFIRMGIKVLVVYCGELRAIPASLVRVSYLGMFEAASLARLKIAMVCSKPPAVGLYFLMRLGNYLCQCR